MEEEHVIQMVESKSNVPINQRDCEENIQDQVIAIEEPPNSSNPTDPKRRELSDEGRLRSVVAASIILCLLLVIFPALEMSSNGGKFNETVELALILPIAIFFQLMILAPATMEPVNNSVFGVIFIILISTAISFIEVSLVSWTAAIIILVIWGIVILSTVIVNWEVIYNEDIVFPKGIQKLIALIWVLWLAYVVKGIMQYLHS